MIGAGAAVLENINDSVGAQSATCSVVFKQLLDAAVVFVVSVKVVGSDSYNKGVFVSFVKDLRPSIEIQALENP